jgi:hypothetical protein
MKKLLYILLLSPLFFVSSCEEDVVHGCLDSQACNYNSQATIDNNSYEYPPSGYDCDDVCIDGQACNFGLTEQCQYPEQFYDCDGNIDVQVGDVVFGGIVFYIDETAQHGLVAAIEDMEGTYYEWGCYGTSISGADGEDLGTGYQNTLDIVAGCSEAPIAASEALAYESGGYTDWYLPSKYELVEMYNTIGNGGPEGNIGGFDLVYWSSSEANSGGAWVVYFSNGYAYNNYSKSNPLRVRVIRAF